MILTDIDKTQKRISRLLKRAESSDGEAELLFMADDPSNSEKIRTLRVNADTLRKRAESMTNIRMHKLKNTLAAFRTNGLLPGINDYVVLQNKV